MKIIVAGTGKVGNLLADQLTRDGHDLVVIDKNSAALEAALEQYDVMSIEGNSGIGERSSRRQHRADGSADCGHRGR